MKKLFFIYYLLGVLLSSCGTMNVYVNTESTYSRENPITINLSKDDETGTLGELRFLLQSNGYKIMSYSAAKKSLNIDDVSNTRTELTNTVAFNSIYVLDLDYTYYYDVFYFAYRNFSATITNMRTGEIIMTANFRGDKGCRAVLNELINKMNKVIR